MEQITVPAMRKSRTWILKHERFCTPKYETCLRESHAMDIKAQDIL